MLREIWIVGCGPGGAEYLLPAARAAVARAGVMAGAERLFDFFPDFAGRRLELGEGGVVGLLERLAAEDGAAAVLVSGDPGVCSLSAQVLAKFGRERCRIVPGISSVQVAFARLGREWATARILSAHAGAALPLATDLQPEGDVAILAGNPTTDDEVCTLANGLSGTHDMMVCRDLTLPEEMVQPVEGPLRPELLGRGRVLVLLLRRN